MLVLLVVLSASGQASSDDSGLSNLLQPYRGQVVLVDFWASWCGPCRKSFPWMNEMKAKYTDDGLVVIGINLDSDRESADEFLAVYVPNFEILFDQQVLATKLGVAAMPTSFVVGRDGQLSTAHKGFLSKKIPLYEATIIQALNTKLGDS